MGGLEMVGAHSVLALETSTPLLFHPTIISPLLALQLGIDTQGGSSSGPREGQGGPRALRSMPQFLPTPLLPLLLVCRLPHRLQPLDWPLRFCGGF